jgi:peptidoglycan/LPS O-acetylase OafA/YrhL
MALFSEVIVSIDGAAQHLTHKSDRPGPNGPIHDLTCVRALFAGWVYLYHLNLQLGGGGGWLHRGYLGVDGFFVLSGAVLTLAHPDPPRGAGPVLRFWLRRLLRLYPVHLAVLALMLALLAAAAAAGVTPNDPGRFDPGELWRSLLLVHGWGLSDRWAWNYPSWSISTEWAGYLLFPALLLAGRALPSAALAAVPAVALAVLIWVGGGTVGLNLTYAGALGRFFPEFAAGIALCLIGRRIRWRPGAGAVALTVAALGVVVAVLPDAGVVAVLWGVLLVLLLRGDAALLDRVPGLRWLGTLSYAFYMSFALTEMALAAVWRRLGTAPPDHPAAYAAASLALTLVLALALSFGIERPVLRRARGIGARRLRLASGARSD